MQNARAKWKQIGRPKITIDDIPGKFWKLYALYKSGQMNKTEIAGAMHCSRSTVYKYIDIVEKY